MKIVINDCYGGFSIPDSVAEELGYESGYSFDEKDSIRTDSRLIKMIEEHDPRLKNIPGSELSVVTIPDNATDWMMKEYDGIEIIYYVIDGKIEQAYPD